MKNLLLLLLLFNIFFSCQKKKIKYEFKRAYIYKVNPFHTSGHSFKLQVSYRFEYKNKLYDSFYNYHLGRITSSFSHHEGDSVLIKFPAGHPEKSEGIEPVNPN